MDTYKQLSMLQQCEMNQLAHFAPAIHKEFPYLSDYIKHENKNPIIIHKINNQIVGVAGLFFNNSPYVFVVREYRHMGVGTKLMQQLFDIIPEPIELSIENENDLKFAIHVARATKRLICIYYNNSNDNNTKIEHQHLPKNVYIA